MVAIRRMTVNDAEVVAALTTQLGYPATAEEIGRRIAGLDDGETEAPLVGEVDERVVGWIHVRGVHLLEADPSAEIWGLVVDEACRGQGIGRQLVDAAERWAIERGYGTMRVRSNVVRDGAHRFYEGLGFAVVKTSYTFRKRLGGDAPV